MAAVITMSGITKTYQVGPVETRVLKGVDLAVEEGEFTAIMGGSGGGKSTLMNIIGLLDRPTDGSYLLDDAETSKLGDVDLSLVRNQKIGFVFQAYHLLPRLTAWENASLPLIYRGAKEPERKEKALHRLEQVGLADWAGHRPTEMSGGQQQRVAIARALVGGPSLILADEPTGALDTKNSREVMDLFTQLNEDDGLTIVIITHDPELGQECKRSLWLEDGRLE